MDRKIPSSEHLEHTLLFSTLPKEKLHGLIHENKITCVLYSPGEMVHLESETCSSVEIVIEGHLSVEQVGEDGDVFSVANFGPESLIGGNVVFSSLPRYTHSIVAIEKSLLLGIQSETLFGLLAAYDLFLRKFLTLISDNTVMVNNRLSHMMQYSLRERLTLYIKSEMVRQDSPTMELPVTKTRLAQMLGVSRTSISRELAKMRDEDLLVLDKRNITLLNT